MGQVTLYLDAETETTLKAEATAAGVSVSRWVAGAIRARAGDRWPPSIAALAGSWAELPEVEAATPPRELAIPAVVLYELEVGAVKSGSPHRRRRQLDELVSWMTLLPFGAAEARTAALVRADLERAGSPAGPLDTLIAVTALHYGATLVTRNLKELEPVRHLRTVDWYDELVT